MDIKQLVIDKKNSRMSYETRSGEKKELALYSDEAFEILSAEWVTLGWNQKYTYSFSWYGRPIIQLPEDMIRAQEVIFALKPDFVIETGVAHGGSLIFYASLLQNLNKGRVIGVDIEIRPHNLEAIKSHPLSHLIDLHVGDSVSERILDQVRKKLKPDSKCLVFLDSNHSYEHVYKELVAYSGMVSVGSYIVATDGIMQDLTDVPRGQKNWDKDNPVKAVERFLSENPNFVYEQPKWPFNESTLNKNITHWPKAWLKRVK